MIPSFNPEEGLKYSQWLKVFNQQIKLRNIKQEDALFMIPTLFKGNALEIYATICDEIDTLEDLHSRMMTFFPEFERGLHKKFWQLTKQETQSVRGYYFEKVKIGTQLHMPKDLVLESLTSGAGPLEKFLIASSPQSLEDWLRIAESLEHTTQQRDGRWNNGRRNNFAGGNRPNMASRWRSITQQHGDVNAGQLHEPGHPGTSSIGLQSASNPGGAVRCHRRTFEAFKAGRISIEDATRRDAQNFKGLMKMCRKITDLIKENPRTTLLDLEQDTGISKTTIGRIVTEDLKLKKTPAKFIPRFLTNEQNLCRLATCEDMLKMTRTDPEWKDKIITGDEKWVYGYDPETKRQSAEWRGQVSMYTGDIKHGLDLQELTAMTALAHYNKSQLHLASTELLIIHSHKESLTKLMKNRAGVSGLGSSGRHYQLSPKSKELDR
ncbi:hypothetical protein LAZ67_4002894 [Cordylochernes scorpioides]|uniref:Transposase n=1 Tax=Cordylochernes scorpioides TaxID=51811 RepID=A0ABY6KDY9_9ARAC|nr:hypothetical protein LAZ67_4002894 [Cordylochernes scorpioides]